MCVATGTMLCYCYNLLKVGLLSIHQVPVKQKVYSFDSAHPALAQQHYLRTADQNRWGWCMESNCYMLLQLLLLLLLASEGSGVVPTCIQKPCDAVHICLLPRCDSTVNAYWDSLLI